MYDLIGVGLLKNCCFWMISSASLIGRAKSSFLEIIKLLSRTEAWWSWEESELLNRRRLLPLLRLLTVDRRMVMEEVPSLWCWWMVLLANWLLVVLRGY